MLSGHEVLALLESGKSEGASGKDKENRTELEDERSRYSEGSLISSTCAHNLDRLERSLADVFAGSSRASALNAIRSRQTSSEDEQF